MIKFRRFSTAGVPQKGFSRSVLKITIVVDENNVKLTDITFLIVRNILGL